MKESFNCSVCGKDTEVETAADSKTIKYGAYDLFNDMFRYRLCYKCNVERLKKVQNER